MLVVGGGNRFRLERQQVVKEVNKLWFRSLGGIWIYSRSRTQRNITLSSTESEFVVPLVSGTCEGLLFRAVF